MGRPSNDTLATRDGERRIASWFNDVDRREDWTHRPTRGPMSDLERQHKHREAAREISQDFAKAVENIDWARRRRALANPRAFIVEYCMDDGGIFDYEPFEETDAIIDCMLKSAEASVPYHIRITRGGGKTTLMIWLAAYLICRKVKRFIVLTGSKMDNAGPMVEDLAALFLSSPALIQDFPEHSMPLVALGGAMQKASSQRFLGKPTLCRVTRKSMRFPVLPSCPLLKGFEGGQIVLAAGFEGRVRGLRVGKRRPDFVLLDDLQDDEMANNAERVEEARRKIYKTFMKLGKSTERPSVLMTSTAIAPGDLSEVIAADPNWVTETFPLLYSFPSEEAMKLWNEYQQIRNTDVVNRCYDHNELKFYIEHREAMDDGARPMWKQCFKRDNAEISAIQSAMNIYLEDPESFMSEYQMSPRRAELALDVPREIVVKRILPGTHEGVVPDGYVFVAAATDINPSYALTTDIVAFKADRTAHLVKRIITPCQIDGKLNERLFNDRVYSAFYGVGEALARLGLHINGWGIDGSGRQFEAATAFSRVARLQPSIGLTCVAMLGRASMRFNPFVKSRLADAVNDTVWCGDPVAHVEEEKHIRPENGKGKRYMFWNADLYKEIAQRAVLSEVGAPGGFTLFAGGNHVDYAIQLTNERLVGKFTRPDGREDYTWKTFEPHDDLDATAMCFAIAAARGYAGGCSAAPAVRKRKVRYVLKK